MFTFHLSIEQLRITLKFLSGLLLCFLYSLSVTTYCLAYTLKHSRPVGDNVIYHVYNSTELPLVAHVVKFPLHNTRLKLIPALGQREEVSSIARRSGAQLAINGSNYRRGGKYNGNRVNLLCLGNQIWADLNFIRGAFGWCQKSKSIVFDKIVLNKFLYINSYLQDVDGVNQPRSSGQSILYNHLADVTLLNHTPGKNIIINDSGEIVEITDKNPCCIPDDWFVYQVDKEKLTMITKGDSVTIRFEVGSAHASAIYSGYDFILAGAGLLIKDSKVVSHELYDEFSQGSAIVHCSDEVAADFHEPAMQQWLIDQKHPRTAIGITHDGDICMVVIDGRQQASVGMTLHELAFFMKELGCIHALNIGGGGCSTLYAENKVINCFSDQAERPVSEALCFFVE